MISKSEKKVIVLMACHNRRAFTLRTLQCVIAQKVGGPIKFGWDLILVDDGSSDGTVEAVLGLLPRTKIIHGNGTLFWAKAMAIAEMEAINNRVGGTHFLWLNDDTFLDQDAFARLLKFSCQYPDSILVGATRDPQTGEQTYGGFLRRNWHPLRFSLVGLSASVQKIDSFNGNVVLIPFSIQTKVGCIDGKFPHGLADIDYGLRAKKNNISMFQIPGTVGVCTIGDRIDNHKLSLLKRWQFIESPLGCPFRAQARFLKRHASWIWPVILIAGYFKQIVWGLKKGNPTLR